MQGLNKVFLMGRIGSDPQVQTSQRGSHYARLSVATNRSKKNPDGDGYKEETSWHTVFVWGKQGELCASILKRGAPVLIEGYLSSYSVPVGEGETHWKSSITADKVSFLPNPQQRPVEHKFDS